MMKLLMLLLFMMLVTFPYFTSYSPLTRRGCASRASSSVSVIDCSFTLSSCKKLFGFLPAIGAAVEKAFF